MSSSSPCHMDAGKLLASRQAGRRVRPPVSSVSADRQPRCFTSQLTLIDPLHSEPLPLSSTPPFRRFRGGVRSSDTPLSRRRLGFFRRYPGFGPPASHYGLGRWPPRERPLLVNRGTSPLPGARVVQVGVGFWCLPPLINLNFHSHPSFVAGGEVRGGQVGKLSAWSPLPSRCFDGPM